MKKLIFFLMVGMIAFSSCEEDDLNNNNNNNTNNNNNNTNNNNNNNNACANTGTMAVTYDGANTTHTNFNNTLLHETQGGEQGRRLDLRTNLGNGFLVVSVSNWDWQNPPAGGVLEKLYSTQSIGTNTACTNISGFDFCDAALVTYLETGGVTYASIDEDYDGFIEISDNNAGTHSVSGSFNARLVDIFGSGDTIYTSGTFTDLCYTVLN